ncbi:hypothetical protein BKI52_08235 [marine bacterium AO1-C]|nr:hypothetical protein BKI52_08235 [marine bacterium AO1-C]
MKKLAPLCLIIFIAASLSFQAFGQKSRLAPKSQSSPSIKLLKSLDALNLQTFDPISYIYTKAPNSQLWSNSIYRSTRGFNQVAHLNTPKAVPEAGHPPYFYANGKMMNEVEYPKRWTRIKTPTMLRMTSRNITLGKKK